MSTKGSHPRPRNKEQEKRYVKNWNEIDFSPKEKDRERITEIKKGARTRIVYKS